MDVASPASDFVGGFQKSSIDIIDTNLVSLSLIKVLGSVVDGDKEFSLAWSSFLEAIIIILGIDGWFHI